MLIVSSGRENLLGNEKRIFEQRISKAAKRGWADDAIDCRAA
jgi:hypothetical protein